MAISLDIRPSWRITTSNEMQTHFLIRNFRCTTKKGFLSVFFHLFQYCFVNTMDEWIMIELYSDENQLEETKKPFLKFSEKSSLNLKNSIKRIHFMSIHSIEKQIHQSLCKNSGFISLFRTSGTLAMVNWTLAMQICCSYLECLLSCSHKIF